MLQTFETFAKFPGGMMVIPLLIGCLVNTFIPQCLEIGGFTTALFKSGQAIFSPQRVGGHRTVISHSAGRSVVTGFEIQSRNGPLRLTAADSPKQFRNGGIFS